MNLRDAHVVITGGGTGVGAATARVFADAGARVTVMGRTEASLKALGLHYQVCDVTQADTVEQAFDNARAHLGPVHIVIANAGAAISKPFSRMSCDDLTQMMDVNLVGVFNTWQTALPDMRKAESGRLIAIASTAGLKGYPYVSGYCAAKHGVIGLMRSLALELASTGITVNAVCPGFIDTPMLERSIDNIVAKTGVSAEEAASALKRNNPQGRFIEVDEVAGASLWLCSDAARSVTGLALSISGGET